MSHATQVVCRDLHKSVGGREVLRGIDWRVPSARISGLVGASGSGKTTLLRILAGLDDADSGSVSFDSGAASSAALSGGTTEPKRSVRPRVGFAFQNLALWPHLTARQHLRCVLDGRDAGWHEDDLLREVCLPHSAWDRRPAELSGGEAQRLSLARALAIRPELLLLDEPLAQVDTPYRDELLELIRALAERHGCTVVYVTHSWRELLAICHEMAVLVDGRLTQVGPTNEVYRRPINESVARLTGPVVALPRELVSSGVIHAEPNDSLIAADDSVLVRPQQIRLSAATEANRWRIESCLPSGIGWEVRLKAQAVSPSISKVELKLVLPSRAREGDIVGIVMNGDG